MTLLVLSAGRRVALIDCFRQSAGGLGISLRVVAADLAPDISAACHAADVSVALTSAREPGWGDDLLQICAEHRVDFVLPTNDIELGPLAGLKRCLENGGARSFVSEPDFVRTCRDKGQTAHFLRSRGIQTPEPLDKGELVYPLFARRVDGSASADCWLAREPGDLPPRILEAEGFVFQKAVDRSVFQEFTVDVLYDKSGRLVGAVPRLRMEVRSGEVSKSRVQENVLSQVVNDKLGSIEGAYGAMAFQFFVSRDEAVVLGIELNARFGGGFPLSYQAGADFPGYMLAEACGLPLPEPRPIQDGLTMLRFDQAYFI